MQIFELNSSQSFNSDDSKSEVCSGVKKEIFLGTYKERRYVECLQVYRDIVEVNEQAVDFIKHLKEIRKEFSRERSNYKWIGITSNDNDGVQTYNLWVELKNIPLGNHWFQVRGVKCDNDEVKLRLKHVQEHKASICPNRDDSDIFNINDLNFNLKEIFTYSNLCETIRFCTLVGLTLFTFLVNFMWYISNFTLILLQTLNNTLVALTPVMLGMIDFCSRCVGGLYWLIFMLIKGPPVTKVPNISYNSYNDQRKLTILAPDANRLTLNRYKPTPRYID